MHLVIDTTENFDYKQANISIAAFMWTLIKTAHDYQRENSGIIEIKTSHSYRLKLKASIHIEEENTIQLTVNIESKKPNDFLLSSIMHYLAQEINELIVRITQIIISALEMVQFDFERADKLIRKAVQTEPDDTEEYDTSYEWKPPA